MAIKAAPVSGQPEPAPVSRMTQTQDKDDAPMTSFEVRFVSDEDFRRSLARVMTAHDRLLAKLAE